MAFIEQTDLEKGFADLWETEIAPSLAAYRAAYNPRFWLAVIGQPVAIMLAVLAYEPLSAWILSINSQADTFARVICIIFAGLAMFGFYYPLSKVQGSFDTFMKQIVSDHFGDILLAADKPERAETLIGKLQNLDLMEAGRRHIKNHYIGKYRDCDLEMFNLSLQSGSGNNRANYDYFVLDVSVPRAFDGAVIIKSDGGRIFNFLRGVFSEHKQVKFDHAPFEKAYEVYAEDADLARRLITPPFCDNLLAIPPLFPRAYGLFSNKLKGAFHENRFTLLVPHNDDLFGLWPHQTMPSRVESGCRRLIARMGIVKNVIDYLHGAR